jgi:hypothetical protein
VLKQAYEMAVGATSHLLKNRSTQKVATQVDISGKLTKPDVSTWQALGELIRNAFFKAILPGFNRQVQEISSKTTRQANPATHNEPNRQPVRIGRRTVRPGISPSR